MSLYLCTLRFGSGISENLPAAVYKMRGICYTAIMTGQTFTIKARAKVNLSLNITGAEGGMHVLDSIMTSISICDTVRLSFNADGVSNAVFRGCGGALPNIPSENSVTKAVKYLSQFMPGLGADVTVDKGIPLAGGLGGSSADAAAVIAAATRIPQLESRRDEIIKSSVAVGSDVPAMCVGGAVRVRGTGESIMRISAKPLYLVVASKGGGVESRASYRKFDELYPSKKFAPSDNGKLIKALEAGDAKEVARYIGNALTAPSVELCPDIGDTLKAVESTHPLTSFMTGSGNCCCGLYESKVQASGAERELGERGFAAFCADTCGEGVTFI